MRWKIMYDSFFFDLDTRRIIILDSKTIVPSSVLETLEEASLILSLSRICPPPPFFSGINSIGEIPQVDSSRLALVTTRKRKDGGGHKTGSAIFSRPAKYVESVACSLLQSLAVVTSAAADCPEYRTS